MKPGIAFTAYLQGRTLEVTYYGKVTWRLVPVPLEPAHMPATTPDPYAEIKYDDEGNPYLENSSLLN
jgi:hypothetical protein